MKPQADRGRAATQHLQKLSIAGASYDGLPWPPWDDFARVRVHAVAPCSRPPSVAAPPTLARADCMGAALAIAAGRPCLHAQLHTASRHVYAPGPVDSAFSNSKPMGKRQGEQNHSV